MPLTHRLLLRLPRTAFPHPLTSHRAFTSTPFTLIHKDDSSRESMRIEPNEYSKSGSDNDPRMHDTAFDPSTTDPETQKKEAAGPGGDSDNPLQVSPANHEISKPKEDVPEGSAHETGEGSARKGSSGGKSTGEKV